MIFIHSQYGAHVSSRTEYHVCVKKMFQIINNDEILNNKNCKVKDDKTFYPVFIQKEISKITKEDHNISKIGPWIIYIWFFKSSFKNLINILFKFKILSDNSTIYIRTNNLDANMSKDYAKMHLLESSLYNMVLFPTFIFLILYSYKYFCVK